MWKGVECLVGGNADADGEISVQVRLLPLRRNPASVDSWKERREEVGMEVLQSRAEDSTISIFLIYGHLRIMIYPCIHQHPHNRGLPINMMSSVAANRLWQQL